MCDDKDDAGISATFSTESNNDKTTAMAIVTGLGLLAMWGGIAAIIISLISAGYISGFLIFCVILIGGGMTAAVL